MAGADRIPGPPQDLTRGQQESSSACHLQILMFEGRRHAADFRLRETVPRGFVAPRRDGVSDLCRDLAIGASRVVRSPGAGPLYEPVELIMPITRVCMFYFALQPFTGPGWKNFSGVITPSRL